MTDGGHSTISAAALELLNRGHHGHVRLDDFSFSPDHCRALANFTGSVEFCECELQDGGRTILDQVSENHGPEKLGFLQVALDPVSLENALARSESLKELRMEGEYIPFRALADGLRQNRSLTEFRFEPDEFEDDIWTEVIGSLSTHPSLRSLTIGAEDWSEEFVQRAHAVSEMLKMNTVLCQLDDVHHILDGDIL